MIFSQIPAGKNFVVFGDSVSAEETYDNRGKTYVDLIVRALHGNLLRNYAIGGTTVTYMYQGSNIEKEYGENYVAIDGVRVADMAFRKHELDEVDVAFIQYGHNDQYFQPPLDQKEKNVEDFSHIASFQESYRYIIHLLRKANPAVQIILINCTYSEYAARSNQWPHVLTYFDYRRAIEEVANEKNCFLIDPWDYLQRYFDGKNEKHFYHDDVHLSPFGHEKLANFILQQ